MSAPDATSRVETRLGPPIALELLPNGTQIGECDAGVCRELCDELFNLPHTLDGNIVEINTQLEPTCTTQSVPVSSTCTCAYATDSMTGNWSAPISASLPYRYLLIPHLATANCSDPFWPGCDADTCNSYFYWPTNPSLQASVTAYDGRIAYDGAPTIDPIDGSFSSASCQTLFNVTATAPSAPPLPSAEVNAGHNVAFRFNPILLLAGIILAVLLCGVCFLGLNWCLGGK